MIKRTLSTTVLLSTIAWVIFGAPLWIFGLVVAAFTGLALHEFFSMVERKGIFLYRTLGLIIGIIIPLSILIGFESTKGWELALMVAALLMLFVLQLARSDSSQAIVGIGTVFFGIFYISWCFSFIGRLRIIDFSGVDGRWLVAFLILVTKVGDMGAYVIGSKLGKHTLLQRISPSKTWEGLVGGLCCSLVAAYFMGQQLAPVVSMTHCLWLGLILGFVAQLGDLSESMIKRDCQIKDSGRVFPGMGGMLDLIDSLLFTSPIFYFYLWHFVFA